MNINDILTSSAFTLINSVTTDDSPVTGVFASDLLSHVMGNADEGNILITVLSNINVLGVASLLDLSGVVLAHNAAVEEDVISKANELGIPMIRTALSTAQAVLSLHQLDQ